MTKHFANTVYVMNGISEISNIIFDPFFTCCLIDKMKRLNMPIWITLKLMPQKKTSNPRLITLKVKVPNQIPAST